MKKHTTPTNILYVCPDGQTFVRLRDGDFYTVPKDKEQDDGVDNSVILEIAENNGKHHFEEMRAITNR